MGWTLDIGIGFRCFNELFYGGGVLSGFKAKTGQARLLISYSAMLWLICVYFKLSVLSGYRTG